MKRTLPFGMRTFITIGITPLVKKDFLCDLCISSAAGGELLFKRIKMNFAGIDIGSRTIELVVINEAGEIIQSLQTDTGFDPARTAKELLSQVQYDHIMATGYGRNLFEITFDAPTVTEIKAHATGARAFFPEICTIIDIGGQDSKAISLFQNGKVLEVMAKNLGYNIEDFGKEALLSEKVIAISSMCTVFAESEVTSLIAKGQNRRSIAKGLHASVVNRVSGMINRISSEGDIVFTGGVAKNPCMREMLSKKLLRNIVVPDDPQLVGAYGAALLIKEN